MTIEPKDRCEVGCQASRKHHKCLPYLAGGGHRISRAGRWSVTDMVKLRKLILGFNCQFPPPIPDLGGERVLQAKWLLEAVSVFGRFWGYKIVPNFTIFYQKRAANGLEQAVKGHLIGGFGSPVLLKRVKSYGLCQALSSQLSVIRNRPSVLVDPPTCDSRTEIAVNGAERLFRGSSGATESLRGQSIDSMVVISNIPQPKKSRHAESKGLSSGLKSVSGDRQTIFWGLSAD